MGAALAILGAAGAGRLSRSGRGCRAWGCARSGRSTRPPTGTSPTSCWWTFRRSGAVPAMRAVYAGKCARRPTTQRVCAVCCCAMCGVVCCSVHSLHAWSPWRKPGLSCCCWGKRAAACSRAAFLLRTHLPLTLASLHLLAPSQNDMAWPRFWSPPHPQGMPVGRAHASRNDIRRDPSLSTMLLGEVAEVT
jgi:hypothetical protein